MVQQDLFTSKLTVCNKSCNSEGGFTHQNRDIVTAVTSYKNLDLSPSQLLFADFLPLDFVSSYKRGQQDTGGYKTEKREPGITQKPPSPKVLASRNHFLSKFDEDL